MRLVLVRQVVRLARFFFLWANTDKTEGLRWVFVDRLEMVLRWSARPLEKLSEVQYRLDIKTFPKPYTMTRLGIV